MTLPRVGISSCLLGHLVRYDGGHKRDPFAAGALGDRVELVPVCPEVEAGMGVPREPVRLERSRGKIRMVGVESGTDHTAAMRAYAGRRVTELEALDLSGYVFKKNSPSCGPKGVPIHENGRPASGDGRGLFAAALCERMPGLPVIDESHLATPKGRSEFLRQVYAYRRSKAPTTKALGPVPSSRRRRPARSE